jgi:ubiquinone/menaquinone biosynthesis C-methylase UbiE
MNKSDKFRVKKENIIKCYDWNSEAGKLDLHYFLQDIYMAKKVLANKPIKHYDIGSRIDGFIAHLITSMEVTLIDIRPLNVNVEGLNFKQGNATDLSNIKDGTIESLSCLHALEHFGLGRYGDPIKPNAYIIALQEMQRIVKTGGKLYLSVPIGDEERVCFNAHREFNPLTIINNLKDMTLLEFAFIKDMEITTCNPLDSNTEYGVYSCGLFVFEKK